ncbi:MAG: hypothetical protein KGD60_05930 [Candidatus Thorarchaeota archaeon]|nr:hypothetical protein [Candidatus Thorarchaeota archaeon]
MDIVEIVGHVRMKKTRVILSVVIILLMCFPMIAFPSEAHVVAAVGDNQGAYLESVEYLVIENDLQRVLSLQNGSIDMLIGYLPENYFDDLAETEHVAIETQMNYGYGQLIFNCFKYPLNESSFRRAFAYALNKTAFAEPYASIYAPYRTQQLAHDALFPKINPLTAEGSLPAIYYDEDIVAANQTLDEGGFLDDDGDGWREAPDGSDFHVSIEVPVGSYFPAMAQIIDDTLAAIGIEGDGRVSDYYEYMDRVELHGDFDIVYHRTNWPEYIATIPRNPLTLDVEFLKHFTSDKYMVEDYSAPNWVNTTYDYWVDSFFNASSKTEMEEAASEIQHIWFEECPTVICHNIVETVAYRTDKLQDLHVNQVGEFVFPWSSYFARLADAEGGPIGGTLRIGYEEEIETFNYMRAGKQFDSVYIYMESSRDLLEHLQVTLVNIDENGQYIPWLAETYTIENKDDNPAVPVGHSRITFELRDGLKWSDGSDITANDVAYSLNYYRDSAQYGNPVGALFEGMVAAYAPSSSTFIAEFSEPYCHLRLSSFAVANIVPQTTFDSVGTTGWESWNPILGADDFVTGGPFQLTSHTPGERTLLTYNPYFFNLVEHTTPAVIIGPLSIDIVGGSQGNTIQWNITGADPGSYTIYRDQSVVDSGDWEGGAIMTSIDGLSGGTHNFTLSVEDAYGKTSKHTVLVTVSSSEIPLVPLIAIASVAVIVIVGALFVKKR